MKCGKFRVLLCYEPFFPVFEKFDEKFVLVVGKKNSENYQLFFSQTKGLSK